MLLLRLTSTTSHLHLLLLTALAVLPLALASPRPADYAPPTSDDTSSWTNETTFKDTLLNSTNTYRAQHDASPVKWNDSLAEAADKWAERCEWKHSGGPTGENLATGYPNLTSAVEGWGNERTKYNFKHGDFGEATGHFSQLVWRNTTSVGCAAVDCGEKKDGKDGEGKAWSWFLVCEYYPPGNVLGQFGDNVMRGGYSGGAVRV